MEYTAQHDEDSGLCTVVVTGTLQRPHDSVKLQQCARDFGGEHNCSRFLFDLTRAQIVGSTTDAFQAGTVPADTDRRQRVQTIALVYAGDASDHKFVETVAVNRGYNVRVFNDFNEAREWLAAGQREVVG